MLRIAISTIFIALLALSASAAVQAADSDTTLVQLRKLIGQREWKSLVEQFETVDFAAWGADQSAQSAEAFHLRGQAYWFLRQGPKADADLRQAIKLAPMNAGMWLTLADNCFYLLQDNDQSLAAYRQAYKLTGKSNGWQPLTATVSIARILIDQGKSKEALDVLGQYGDMEGMAATWRIKMHRAAAQAHAALGNEAQALTHFRTALELESPAPATTVEPPATVPAPPIARRDDASPLFAGTAKVEITPDKGTAVNLAGQPLSPREPLYARVLVLKNQQTSLAIVSIDLIVFSSRKVIESAKAQWGVEHVILSATHTHAAPAPRGLLIQPPTAPDWTRNSKDPGATIDWPALSADPWYAATEAKVIAAIGQAMQNLFPARLVSGKGSFTSAYMAHNRRRVQDGRTTMMWDNPDRRLTQPIDPTLGVIRIDDQQGRPRAMAVQYACHPVATMTAGVVSRDFPGAMVDEIEQALGPECMAMFLQGAQGDLDPYDLSSLRGENRFNIMRQSGISLARGALRIAQQLPSDPSASSASIQIQTSLVTVPYRHGQQTTTIGLLSAVINHQLALVAIPGEPFIQHQLDLTAQSPLPQTFILGLAYHGQGSPFVVYIPTVQAVQDGGYGATECSFVAADTGAKLVAAALTHLRACVAPPRGQ